MIRTDAQADRSFGLLSVLGLKRAAGWNVNPRLAEGYVPLQVERTMGKERRWNPDCVLCSVEQGVVQPSRRQQKPLTGKSRKGLFCVAGEHENRTHLS